MNIEEHKKTSSRGWWKPGITALEVESSFLISFLHLLFPGTARLSSDLVSLSIALTHKCSNLPN